MSDFLNKLRTEKDKRPKKAGTRYRSSQYHYESQKKFFGNEKRNGNDRRKERLTASNIQETLTNSIVEITPAVIEFMSAVAENKKRIAIAEEQKARAEERKADAFENILKELKTSGLESILSLQDGAKKRKKVKKPFDQHRKNILQIISKLRNKGETFDNIALHLQRENMKTFSGRGQWHAQTVHRLYQDHILE